MALKFRRGTTAQQSGSLAFGEPYVNTTLGTLLIGGPNGDIVLSTSGTGSTGNFGAISGSGLDITGNANIAGNVTVGGQLQIGDATADTVNVVASLSSSLIPQTTNAFDLGSASKIWRDLYISSGSIKMYDGAGTLVSTITATSLNSNTSSINALNSFSASQLTQNSALATISGSLISSASAAKTTNDSQGVSITNLNSATASLIIETTNLETFSASVLTRLTEVGVVTGSLISSASAAKTTNDSHGVSITNINSFSASANTSISSLNTTTASLNTSVSNLNSFSSSQLGKDATLATLTASYDGRFTTLSTVTSSYDGRFTTLSTVTSSYDGRFSTLSTVTSSYDGRFSTLSTVTSSYDGRFTTLGTYTGSVEGRFTTLATLTGSNATRLSNLETTTASLNTSVSNLNSTTASLNVSVSNLNSFTSSFNTAFGLSGANVTVKGNLTVQGSTTQIDSTTLNIADNIIQLNGTGATNAGLVVRDATAATTTSGSLLWDTTNDKWIAGPLGSEDDVVLRTLAQTLTNKTVSGASNTLSNIANASLSNSSITIAGTSVSLGGSITLATITGASGIVSGSSQIDHNLTTNYSANRHIDHTAVTMTAGNGLSGGGDISATRTLTLDTASAHFLGGSRAAISVSDTTGASGIDLTYNSSTGVLSGVLANSAITIAGNSTSLGGSITLATITGASGIVSGSSQVTPLLPAGTVSGSSQVYSGVSGDITIASNGVATIAANSVALGTDTTGNYMADVTAGSGISITHTPGEGSTATITNSGVRSIAAGTGVSVSATTGDNCSISIGQAVGTGNSPTFAGLTINGSITATGDITAYYSSDIRFKDNVVVIGDALDKVKKLRGVKWDWNDSASEVTKAAPNTGLIAQEVQQVLPEVVKEREDGYLGLDYSKMVGLLVEAIKEQQNKIDNLTIELAELKKQKGL